jgi:hypothetical protein
MKITVERIKEIIKEEHEKLYSTEIADELDSENFKAAETIILTSVRDLIRDGANTEQMDRLVQGIEAAIQYGFAGKRMLPKG